MPRSLLRGFFASRVVYGQADFFGCCLHVVPSQYKPCYFMLKFEDLFDYNKELT